jgi:hypothetical protein
MKPMDLQFDVAVAQARQYCDRLKQGRVTLVLHRLDSRTVAHSVAADPLTEEEIDRLMREKPRRKR